MARNIAQPINLISCVSHQFPKGNWMKCGYSSAVERHLAKVNVARSNRVTRLLDETLTLPCFVTLIPLSKYR